MDCELRLSKCYLLLEWELNMKIWLIFSEKISDSAFEQRIHIILVNLKLI